MDQECRHIWERFCVSAYQWKVCYPSVLEVSKSFQFLFIFMREGKSPIQPCFPEGKEMKQSGCDNVMCIWKHYNSCCLAILRLLWYYIIIASIIFSYNPWGSIIYQATLLKHFLSYHSFFVYFLVSLPSWSVCRLYIFGLNCTLGLVCWTFSPIERVGTVLKSPWILGECQFPGFV